VIDQQRRVRACAEAAINIRRIEGNDSMRNR